MKIKITRNIGIDGQHVTIGTIVDAPETLANQLIGSGRAISVETEAKAEVVTSTEGARPFPEEEIEKPTTRRGGRSK